MLTPGAWKRRTAEGGPGPGIEGPEQLSPGPSPPREDLPPILGLVSEK